MGYRVMYITRYGLQSHVHNKMLCLLPSDVVSSNIRRMNGDHKGYNSCKSRQNFIELNDNIMLPNDVLSRIAASCDACTRENLSNTVGTYFPPQKLPAHRLIEIRRFQPRHYQNKSRGENRAVAFQKTSIGLTVSIEHEIFWRHYRYRFRKTRPDGTVVYLNDYRTDNDNLIIPSYPNRCTIKSMTECGCLLCGRHLQTDSRHIIKATDQSWALCYTLPPQRFAESVEKYKHLGLCPEKYKSK